MWYHIKNINRNKIERFMVRRGFFSINGEEIEGDVIPSGDLVEYLRLECKSLEDYRQTISLSNNNITLLELLVEDEIQTVEATTDTVSNSIKYNVGRHPESTIDTKWMVLLDDLSNRIQKHIILQHDFTPIIKAPDTLYLIYDGNTYRANITSLLGERIMNKLFVHPRFKGKVFCERDIPLFEYIEEQQTIYMLHQWNRENKDYVVKMFDLLATFLIKEKESNLPKIGLKSFNALFKDVSVGRLSTARRKITKNTTIMYEIRQKLFALYREQKDLEMYVETYTSIRGSESEEAMREWKAINTHKNVANAYFLNGVLYVITNDIWLRYQGIDFKIGAFLCEIGIDSYSLRFSSLTEERTEPMHPHINSGGTPCLGELSNVLPDLVGKMELYILVESILLFLKSYNNSSPYTHICFWEGYIDGEKVTEYGEDTIPEELNSYWVEDDDVISLQLDLTADGNNRIVPPITTDVDAIDPQETSGVVVSAAVYSMHNVDNEINENIIRQQEGEDHNG